MFEVEVRYSSAFLKAKAVVDILSTIVEETPKQITILATPYMPYKRQGFHLTGDVYPESWAANININDVSDEIMIYMGQCRDFNYPEYTVKEESGIIGRSFGNNYYAAAEALMQWLCFGKLD